MNISIRFADKREEVQYEKCPKCGRINEDLELKCIGCGDPLGASVKKERSWTTDYAFKLSDLWADSSSLEHLLYLLQ